MEKDDGSAGKLFLLDEVMNKRSNPAVVILNQENRLLYFNQEAQEFLQTNQEAPDTAISVTQEISELCKGLKNPAVSDIRNSGLIRDLKGRSCVAVAQFIHPPDDQRDLSIIIVIQPVAESHIDFKKVQERYGLTPREIEVLGLVCAGYSNREISDKLFVSEYTTQDHLKNIMRKMEVSSRSKLIALVI
jgi:DNA-binding CsgD family transcriptional regulator